ncbi:MAG: glutamate ligase domain-containing protein, partial [Anaerolineae bacterium]
IYNILSVIALGINLSVPVEQAASILEKFERVPGRLERVPNRRGLKIFVDYAHTDDALKNVLEALVEIKKRRLIVVFGCGGNRDQSKRPKMAEVAERFADLVIVTSDNPRQEDPQEIITQILKGFRFKDFRRVFVEVDRQRAISLAISLASCDDIVLIAGKGHETTQTFARQTIDFDDRKIAALACEGL